MSAELTWLPVGRRSCAFSAAFSLGRREVSPFLAGTRPLAREYRGYFSGNKLRPLATSRRRGLTHVITVPCACVTADERMKVDRSNQHRLTPGVRARTVVHVCRAATLCTTSIRHEGVPFGSHVDYILDTEGRPIFLLASGAEHTKNIAKESRVSLYCQPPSSSGQGGCRVTLVGEIAKLPESDIHETEEEYIHVHSHASDALKFPDLFEFYRMSVKDVFYVGGFGVVAQWVDPKLYAEAEPDPLAFDAPSIVADLNATRREELKLLCEVFLDQQDMSSCTMMGLDRLGFDLRIRSASGFIREYRVAFREEVRNRFECQSALVKVFQEAWELKHGHADSWQAEGSRPTVLYYALA